MLLEFYLNDGHVLQLTSHVFLKLDKNACPALHRRMNTSADVSEFKTLPFHV
jgi:hypothetical protein